MRDTIISQPEFKAPALPQPLQMKDVRGDPSLDPDRELPLEESSVEGIFRAPVLKDFIVPPYSGRRNKRQGSFN